MVLCFKLMLDNLFLKDNIRMEKLMERANIVMLMDLSIKEIGRMEKFMGMVNLPLLIYIRIN